MSEQADTGATTTVQLHPLDTVVEVPRGTTLLEAGARAGVQIETPCGGEGTCGQCLVRVVDGEVGGDSAGRLPGPALAQGYVLACVSSVEGPRLVMEVPDSSRVITGESSEDEAGHHVLGEVMLRGRGLDPAAEKRRVRVPPPDLEDSGADLDRLVAALCKEPGAREVTYSLAAMRAAAAAIRARDGEVTVTLVGGAGPPRVIRVEPGDTTDRQFAVSMDLGTTSVAVQLLDVQARRILGTRADYNAQIALGEDVIRRINHARKPGGLEDLRQRALGTINRLVASVAGDCGVGPQEITDAAISGNTVMTHLLLGLPPEHIRLDPYTPTFLEAPPLTAAEIGVDVHPDCRVFLSPCVGSYVGGDITAGLLCTDLAADAGEVGLFIDVGTNGELVIGSSEFLVSCACSAGPAFEGGGMECGMRAAPGAIERVRVDQGSARVSCSTIGGAAPRGICGSGMVNLLAELLLTGWIDRGGNLDRGRTSPFIEVSGRRARLVVVPADHSGTGRAIFIDEPEIENVLRAKGAIYSAAALMLEQIGLTFGDLSTIYVAGGFGRYLDIEAAITIGLLPDVPRESFCFLGNASLLGTSLLAVSRDSRLQQRELARRMTYIDLSKDPAYMTQYTGARFLPHTDLRRFPSVAATLGATKRPSGQ